MTDTRRSIVVVTVDCLRADHVGFMGYARPTTPFLDSLSRESLVFPAAIVAGAPTYYSLPAVLASRYPLALGRDVVGIGPEEPTLASVLQRAGHATAAFCAGNPYISARFGYERGFDLFEDFQGTGEESNHFSGSGWASRIDKTLQRIPYRAGPLGMIYDELYFRYCQRVSAGPTSFDDLRRFPSADVIVDHACKWMASLGSKPFFLWLHLMDPHAPYYPKEWAVSAMGDDSITAGRARYLNSYWNRGDVGPRRLTKHRTDVLKLYDAGIRWVDTQIQRLVEFLQGANLWDNCTFALTADHGEEFLDHGGRYHPPSRLMEEVIRVPMLLRIPGAPKKEVGKAPFSLLHLAPTLLEGAQVSIPAEFQGRSWRRQLQQDGQVPGIAISECVDGCTNPFRSESRMGPRILSIREARFKLILHFDPIVEQLFDLEADPSEKNPLPLTDQKPVRRHLLEIAREHLHRSDRERESRMRMQAILRSLRLEWMNSANKGQAAAS